MSCSYTALAFVKMIWADSRERDERKKKKKNIKGKPAGLGQPANSTLYSLLCVPFRTWRVTLAGCRLGGPHE